MLYDIAIIGCGVIGAAAAFELSKYKLNIAVLEKENDVAMGASRANSAIIHAGYDPEPGTLKAKMNIGSSIIFSTAPASVEIIANFGLPSARITGFIA